jgi:hypothetical protein
MLALVIAKLACFLFETGLADVPMILPTYLRCSRPSHAGSLFILPGTRSAVKGLTVIGVKAAQQLVD